MRAACPALLTDIHGKTRWCFRSESLQQVEVDAIWVLDPEHARSPGLVLGGGV
jgi:hypothetical protein